MGGVGLREGLEAEPACGIGTRKLKPLSALLERLHFRGKCHLRENVLHGWKHCLREERGLEGQRWIVHTDVS